MMDLTKMKCCL